MKLISNLSAILLFTTGMTAAVPVGVTAGAPKMVAVIQNRTTTDIPETLEKTNIALRMNLDSASIVRINEKEFTGLLPTFIAFIGTLLGPGLSGSLQAAIAELFKGGDLFLNGPLDVIERLLKLDISGALRTALNTILGFLKSLPKDATTIITGGQKPGKGVVGVLT
ncbi:hypothetical protein NQ176_g3994 [Zarea fungicola]|uniref:Uncharacterized protein n=1 Tax=Zarea fungicola TaxID=93591 RepID=A0ACC1NIF4_9HYPO|nr:hypothetical protein NQ176_g3994 [Lecanicillium fungicola]